MGLYEPECSNCKVLKKIIIIIVSVVPRLTHGLRLTCVFFFNGNDVNTFCNTQFFIHALQSRVTFPYIYIYIFFFS